MKLYFAIIFGLILALNIIQTKADTKTDELTLRNQLFADVFFIKEGVSNLLLSAEVVNRRQTNQQEILKDLQSKLISNDEFDVEETLCDKISGMFNTTFRKYNAFENRMIKKLEEIQDEQTERLDEILLKQRSNKNCGSQAVSATAVSLLSTSLEEMSEKIVKLEEQFVKLQTWETTLNLQQTKFDTFVEKQLKILQDINDKLTKNENQFTKISQELETLKDLKKNVQQIVPSARPRLPMEVILGLTSANITSLNKK